MGAAGGIGPGVTSGRTDDVGFHVVEGLVCVNDVQATVSHLLGIDHPRRTFRHNGIDRRLTDVHGHVIFEVLA